MKKSKLIKSLLFCPLVTIPLVAASCNASKMDAYKISDNYITQTRAANALLTKFKDTEASKFVSITNPAQKAAYSDFEFSTSSVNKSRVPNFDYFMIMLADRTRTAVSKDSAKKTITYTYTANGSSYLYLWAQANIQDPTATKQNTLKKTSVLVAEMNENFQVVLKDDPKAQDAVKINLTGYKKDDEVKQFQQATADSKFYTTNMLYALSVKVNLPVGSNPMSIPDYKAAVEKITSTSDKFIAFTNFEATTAAKLTYASNIITYTPEIAGAIFKNGSNPIKDNIVYTFTALGYNLNLTTGLLTISAPAVLSIPS